MSPDQRHLPRLSRHRDDLQQGLVQLLSGSPRATSPGLGNDPRRVLEQKPESLHEHVTW
jgi:hypothetical protein